LLCDGLHISFYPVQAEKGSAEKVTVIDLTIEKKKMRTAANIARTPFEEENYISSAWSRPQHLPFSRGPRSIRVLGPQPELVVSNITEDATNGKAVEGTVNRILLKLQTGHEEICSDFKIAVTCFSVLISPSGSTTRLVAGDTITTETENSVDMRNPGLRTPILVSPSSSVGAEPNVTELGYDLPMGWKVAGTGQRCSMTDIPPLARGGIAFIHLDFFRPAASTERTIAQNGDLKEDDSVASSRCKTDFYVTISYRQRRPAAQTIKHTRTRRTSRKLPVMSTAKEAVGESTGVSISNHDGSESGSEVLYDDATIEYVGSILWDPPFAATFAAGARKGFPSGMRHPSNNIDFLPSASLDNEWLVANGEVVSTRCVLQLNPLMEGLKAEILSVRFKVRNL
jgi:hypothetical protein